LHHDLNTVKLVYKGNSKEPEQKIIDKQLLFMYMLTLYTLFSNGKLRMSFIDSAVLYVGTFHRQ